MQQQGSACVVLCVVSAECAGAGAESNVVVVGDCGGPLPAPRPMTQARPPHAILALSRGVLGIRNSRQCGFGVALGLTQVYY